MQPLPKSQRVRSASRVVHAGRRLFAGGLAAGSYPLTALACSGPGAAEAIADSFRVVLLSLGITFGWFLAALLVRSLRRRVGLKGLLLLAAMWVFHPGLWLSTRSGDCGYTARWASLLFLPLLALVLGGLLRKQSPTPAAPQGRAAPDVRSR